MKQSYQLALHIFRRDLRLEDNSALIAALNAAKLVIPCFIFDVKQLEKNDYKSDHCVQFMANSLKELHETLQQHFGSQVYFFYGDPENILQQLITTLPIDAVFINRDYTPFSVNRDAQLAKICSKANIDFHVYADALLHEPEEICKVNGEPYVIFTPFFAKAHTLQINHPVRNKHNNYYRDNIAFVDETTLAKLTKRKNPNLAVHGGRKEALQLIKKLAALKNYETLRDYPAEDGTTKLSAHNKFGTISIREVYHAINKEFGNKHALIKELYWRDFFTHIAYHFPHVFGHSFYKKYDHLKWEHHLQHLNAWCSGYTGFPIVDAGMRELNITGYMHNRVRMIVASFLTKDLHIDWRLGEKYFAQKLIDYDPAVNNGNWQWAASTGCDAQPYFRIFNPWLQQQKFDPECLYIKRFVPELASIPPKLIHELPKHITKLMTNYPLPIIDHQIESQKTKMLYSSV